MRKDAVVGAPKIRSEPNIDARDDEVAVIERNRSSAVNKIAGRRLQDPIDGLPNIGVASQVGTADRGAIDGIVNARVLPNWAQDPMLDVVETNFFAFNLENFRLPRAVAGGPVF